ncbi:MAG: hypothetical protein QME66_12345 [Candidatus Eisenbacteria bacterium]|nr:hypothetical protein [Candidatus Eisenbacteria bacterium]
MSTDTGSKSIGSKRWWVLSCLFLPFLLFSSEEALSFNKVDNNDLTDEKGQPQRTYCTRPPCLRTHNIGRLNLIVTNLGFFGSPWVADLSMGWRGGEYLYVGGLWVGALDADGVPHVSTAAYETEFRPSLDVRDIIYEGYEGMPGGSRVTGTTGYKGANDDGDLNAEGGEKIDEDFLDGYDNDNPADGRIDEDFAAISEQMLSCTYTDFATEAIQRYPDHRPLFLKVQQSSFAWSITGYDEFIGVEYKVWNVGQNAIRDVYVGFFVDADAGPKGAPSYWDDDLVGIVDTTVWIPYPESQNANCKFVKRRLKIPFVRDLQEDEAKRQNVRNRGDVPGWAGMILLGHPTDVRGEKAPEEVGVTSLKWFSSGGSYQEGGDPQTDFERYDLMSKGIIPTKNATQANDFRYCLSVGPFAELMPDTFFTFQVAWVIGEGKEGLVASAVAAQKTYDGRWEDVDKDIATPPSPYKETLLKPYMKWTNPSLPNPLYPGECIDTTCAGSAFSITDTVCVEVKAPVYVDNDCDPCTPGQTGAEFAVRWTGETPPPPPNVDRLPGANEVTLEWDNLSETIPGTRFEGYRIWKVSGWQRPIGETKPREEEWQLLAEFYKHPPDSLAMDAKGWPRDSSEHHIRRITDTTVVPTEIKDGIAFYPVGRYRYVDRDGVLDGMGYFYSVTAFSKWMTSTDTSRSEIVGARVDTSSTDAVKDKLGISVATGGYTRYAPKVAFGETNSLAVWATNQRGSWDILAGRVTKEGRLLAQADTVGFPISTARYTQHHPAVAFSKTSYFVVWQDSRNGPYDIYGSRVKVDGTAIDTSGILVASGASYQNSPAIAFDRTNDNYLVVWADARVGNYDIYGARVDTFGVVLDSDPIKICSASGDQLNPKVAFDGTGFLVIWADKRHGDCDIYGGRVSGSGSPRDGTGFVIANSRTSPTGGDTTRVAAEQDLPDVCYGAGNYFVVWSDGRERNYDIYATRIDTAGRILDGTGIAISLETSAVKRHQYYPAVSSSGKNYLVTWSDMRNLNNTSLDIYGSRVTASGAVVDQGQNALRLTAAKQVQHSSAVAFDGTNYLAVWEDRRSEETTVTVRTIELSGRPVSTESQIVTARPNASGKGFKVYAVPNPYKGSAEWDLIPAEYDPTGTKVGFFGMPRAKAKLRIFTLSGDLVQEIQHDGTSGAGAVFWNLVSRNGQDVVSGVYLFSVTSDLGNFVGKFVIIR